MSESDSSVERCQKVRAPFVVFAKMDTNADNKFIDVQHCKTKISMN